jgi:NitT/TauT family transport system ATP-binding protein
MAFIAFEDVTVRYGHTVFANLNLQIQQGEFVSIIGATGCGKSTLLRMLLGSERPTSGRVVVDGKVVTHPSRDRGYVPQKYSLFPDKTVIRNVAFGPVAESFALHKLVSPTWWRYRAGVYKEAMDTLLRVGLLERDAPKYPDQLSGGMQQRVAIAQSLIMHPRILLMDESFSALDPNTRKGMQKLIRSIWQESGMTVVFVTHNLAEAVHLGSRVLMLAQGRIALDLAVPEAPGPEELDSILRRLEGDQSLPLEDLAEFVR